MAARQVFLSYCCPWRRSLVRWHLLVIDGLSYGLDFTGGSLVELKFYSEPALENVVKLWVKQVSWIRLCRYLVRQQMWSFASPKMTLLKLETRSSQRLRAAGFEAELLRSELSAQWFGEELREQGGLGLLLALGIVMLYVAFRFQFKFSIGAVVALVHDVLIVLGIFALFD